MQKQEIRSVIKNLLPRFDKSGKYHSALIDRAIQKVLGEMYNEIFAYNPSALQPYCKGYGYTTPLAVNTEASTGLSYTTLPTEIITFPDKASGVRRISTIIQGGMTFFPMYQREHDYVLSGNSINNVTSKIGYAVTPTRVEYYKINAAVLAAGVRMDLVIPFSSYADTDYVSIPEIKGDQGEGFFDRVLAILGVIRPIDALDNNADTQPQQTNNTQG